jgi:hypothetical protein
MHGIDDHHAYWIEIAQARKFRPSRAVLSHMSLPFGMGIESTVFLGEPLVLSACAL